MDFGDSEPPEEIIHEEVKFDLCNAGFFQKSNVVDSKILSAIVIVNLIELCPKNGYQLHVQRGYYLKFL